MSGTACGSERVASGGLVLKKTAFFMATRRELRTAAPPSLSPHALVSLTAPKLCAREFKGRHWLEGRFVPPSMAVTLQLDLPQYCGADPVVLLHGAL